MSTFQMLSGLCLLSTGLLIFGTMFIALISQRPSKPRAKARRSWAALYAAVPEEPRGSFLVYDEIVDFRPGTVGMLRRRKKRS